MKIGLIDVDGGKSFPNIPLMKISSWHKKNGDVVQWYDPLFGGHYDKVYLSKVFSFTRDYEFPINADIIERGGTGYCITNVNGREIFDESKNKNLPNEIEHIYPDYTLYPHLTDNIAYGFLTRGCPRGCKFCIVGGKEGVISKKVAELGEFWRGQKQIVLCDPNILAYKDSNDLLSQLYETGSQVDFNQGLDIRLMTVEKAKLISKIRMKEIHFAWDNYDDKDIILPRLKMFADIANASPKNHNMIVFTLVNYSTTFEQDLERIYLLREMGYWPYVMIYDKANCDIRHKRLQRWVNMRSVFARVHRFEDYK